MKTRLPSTSLQLCRTKVICYNKMRNTFIISGTLITYLAIRILLTVMITLILLKMHNKSD